MTTQRLQILTGLFLSVALGGCDSGQPIQSINASEAEWTTEQARADRYNTLLAEQYQQLKNSSLDGKGQVFYQHGLGIVYTEPHNLTKSTPLSQHVCVETHWLTGDCTAAKEYPTAYRGAITNKGDKLYVFSYKGDSLMCQGKFTITPSFNSGTVPNRCWPFIRENMPTHAYDLLKSKMAQKEPLSHQTALWLNALPK